MVKSGSILGECPFCRDLIYESEIWLLTSSNRLAHLKCENAASEKDKKIADLKAENRRQKRIIKTLERRLKKCLSEASTKIKERRF